jgi:hypothetical protein
MTDSPAVHPFAGIDEKLKRSQAHIENLSLEIEGFFQESDYPTIPQENMQLLLKACQYHEQRMVPLRFSVLTGEIVHHLCSCLDHLVWHFSSPEYREGKHGGFIEFPIRESRPLPKNHATQYGRKVEGIANSAVLRLIEGLQPYNTPDFADYPLLVLHKMDVADKHRGLVLCGGGGGVSIPTDVVQQSIASYQQGIITEIEGQRQMKNHAQVIPVISFRDIGKREPEALLPTLEELHNFVVRIVMRFTEELPCID